MLVAFTENASILPSGGRVSLARQSLRERPSHDREADHQVWRDYAELWNGKDRLKQGTER